MCLGLNICVPFKIYTETSPKEVGLLAVFLRILTEGMDGSRQVFASYSSKGLSPERAVSIDTVPACFLTLNSQPNCEKSVSVSYPFPRSWYFEIPVGRDRDIGYKTVK